MSAPHGLTNAELDVVRIVMICFSALSMIGCAFIVWHHFRSAQLGTKVAQKMVIILSVLDFSCSFPKLFALPADHSVPCTTQGFVLVLTGFMSVLWNCCIADSIYRKVVRRESEAVQKRHLPLYLVCTIVPSLTAACLLLGGEMLGDAIFYCFIREAMWHVLCFYTVVMIAIIYITVVLLVTHATIYRRARRQGNIDALESSALITLRLRIYIIAFSVLWLPSAVFWLCGNAIGQARFPLAVIMQTTLCAQGFVTSVIYGGFLSKVLLYCQREPTFAFYKELSSPSSFTAAFDDEFQSHRSQQPESFQEPVGIFVSTFNLGEAKLSKIDIARWIPLGYDIYVIGVQECLDLIDVRMLIRHHIERRMAPNGQPAVSFHQYNREIGSTNTKLGYHGHIAITVYVKSQDVESGAFYMPPAAQQEVNCGKSLVVGRASNKGAVGLAFRYYDSSFAFVSCHLSSDSKKGRSKVLRRNQETIALLKSLHLNVEDIGFEFPLLHHHNFILGDLNYRLAQGGATAQEILELVSNVRRHELEPQRSTDNRRRLQKRWSWAPSRFPDFSRLTQFRFSTNRFDSLNGGSRSTTTNRTALGVSMLDAKSASIGDVETGVTGSDRLDSVEERFTWEDVLVHDELTKWMSASQVLYGFKEAKIQFPPTYRRKRGAALKKDWKGTSVELTNNYTLSVAHGGERIPSYTDRILYCSQSDMKHRLHCSVYASCEGIKASDHKPVVGIFQALVDREFLPREQQSQPPRPLLTANKRPQLRRMQELHGVVECVLRLEFRDILWRLPPQDMQSDKSSEWRESLARRLDQALITVLFPLPSEDSFSEQRPLHELAFTLSGGVYSGRPSELTSTSNASSSSSALQLKSNLAHKRWSEFVCDGLTHATLAKPLANMHVAIKIHERSTHQSFGQGVVGLPTAWFTNVMETNNNNTGGNGTQTQSHQQLEFAVELGEGGKHTGTLRGSLTLEFIQRRTSLDRNH